MAVIPTPIVSNQTNVFTSNTTTENASAPSVAINPNNPDQMVSVYQLIDPSRAPGPLIQASARFSVDGGQTWQALGLGGNERDTSIALPSQKQFEVASSFVAFDRSDNFYIATLQQSVVPPAGQATAGTITLSKFSFTTGTPAFQAKTFPYSWNQTITTPVDQSRDPAVNTFHLAVDDNMSTFADPTTGQVQTDANSGNVYLALGFDTPPPNPAPGNWSRYSIALTHSTDGGSTFSTPIAVDGFGNSLPSQVTRPRIAISQGTASGTVEGGRVTVIWDDFGSGANDTPFPTDRIQSRSVRATGNSLATVGGRVQVAATRVRGALTGTYGRTTTMTPKGIGPTAEIASDNTLGSFSANQGRLYVAFTDWSNFNNSTDTNSNNPFENTDIALAFSDNGGASWTVGTRKVNDDSAFTDGKTGAATAGDVQNGLATRPLGRSQFMPSVAVDQYTGTVVLSFLDARDDAANARVATYLAASIDGGASFAPQTFANTPVRPTNGITGQQVTLGPIPENQSALSEVEAIFSFGDHQGLAVANGVIHPVWTGNGNGGFNGDENLSIKTARAVISSGPRIESGNMGPVESTTVLGNTFNNNFAADGRPLIDGFTVVFDRRVDASSFSAADVSVIFRDVLTPSSAAGISVAVASVTALNADGGGSATTFLVRLNASAVETLYAGPTGGVGTYSYSVGPAIADRIRYRSTTNPALNSDGNLMDQNGNGISNQTNDAFSAPTSLSGTPLTGPFDTTTLPLIVSGPRVVSTSVPGVAPTPDNLVTDSTIRAIDVTFDRDMRADSFTPADILSILGPAGQVLVPRTEVAVGTDINKVIPNNPATPLQSAISIPSNGTSFPISRLTISLNINHMQDSDLRIELIGPDGTTIVLADGVGGTGQNFVNTVFDDLSKINITSGSAPFTGIYAPTNVATPGQGLDAFIGKQLQGVWRLQVTDKSNNSSTGVLNAWSLTATPSATVTADPEGTGDLRKFRVGFPEQFLRGTYTLSLGADIRSISGRTGTTAADLGAQVDTNRNAGLDLLFDRNPPGINALPQTFTNTLVTVIPNNPATPLVSTIAVPNTGTPFTIGDLNVQLSINHTRDSDLKIELIGPDGTTVVLADGLGGTGQNYTNTSFDDQSTTPIASGVAPFSDTFRPTQSLSAFNGRQLTGTWRLRVTDKVTNAFSGSLLNWSITATTGASVSYNATTTPVAIPAATPAADPGDPVTPSVSRSLLTIPSGFNIQSLTLNLGITYPNDPDLKGDLLVYPVGVDVTDPLAVPSYTIQLFNGDGNVGADGTRRNFTNTVFDDAAPTPIQNGGPPFNGRFNPRTPLSVLSGQNAAGLQYVLQVTNKGLSSGSLDRWGMTLSKAVAVTGLGEAVSDQTSVSFRMFTMDPTNPLSSNEWTPVGPASYSSGKLAGKVTSIAVDPSDPSGNTVFVGAASGGIWKTTNFLTTSTSGPTYIPLTDFGTTLSLNTGNIALFGRNGDPNQTVVVVGTGDPSAQYPTMMGGLDTSRGVGFIRSFDGGVTWTLLDSLVNADAQGNLLPIGARQHDFVGMTVNKVIVDPRPAISGELIMYAAITDPNGRGKTPAGIYRSLDSGRTWQLKRAGIATDILFDDNSGTIDAVSNPTGNFRVLYAAFGNDGVYRTLNQGDRWDRMTGTVGVPAIHDEDNPNNPIPVVNSTSPAGQKIVLARPALTGNVNQDVQYQGWLYAAGVGSDGRFSGLYLTKDFGQTWTRIALPNANTIAGNTNDTAVPTNNDALANYDVAASSVYNLGLANLSLTIDQNDPTIVYVGGTGLGHNSSMIRVNTIGVADSHAFFAGNDKNDGGTLQLNGTGPVDFKGPFPNDVQFSLGYASTNPILNLVRDPNQPFLSNTIVYVNNVASFSNSGSGATWTNFSAALDGSGGIHQIVSVKDPLTGLSRLIMANDQGVFTGIDDDGTYLRGVGSVVLPFQSRNGNLQTTQFYYGASQPSSIAAQTAQALFYGQAQDNGFPESDAGIITPGSAGYGNLQWGEASPWDGSAAYGTGVAADQTGSGTVYKYKWPGQIKDDPQQVVSSTADFFKVKPNGGVEVSRTFGLLQSSNPGIPDPQWPFSNGTGQPLTGNFSVNPLSPNQMIISSSVGRIFGTENQGQFWSVIANPTDLDSRYAGALAYGAPDPNGPGVPGALNNYILAGTDGGHIYVTLTGGGSGGSSNAWFDISAGLVNNDPIRSIITNPTRGSHEAYAVSTSRVYRIADTSMRNASGVVVGSGWVDITGDLFQQTHTPFGDSSLTENLILANSLSSIVADWRYVIPDTTPTPGNPNPPTHPMLYVSGQGGVLRSTNGVNGSANWTVFPDLALNTPQQGGGMPTVQVTDLDMSLGNINPTNGRPDVSTGPNVLLATTYGRGSFAIKLAPLVFESTVSLATGSDSGRPTLPLPGSPDHSGDLTDLYTNVLEPVFQGLSQQSAFGGQVAITLYDATDPLNPIVIGGYDPASGPFVPGSTYFTDTFGRFSVKVNAGVFLADHSTDGVKVIRVQATDQSGTRGNQASFTFTLDTAAPGDPVAPIAPSLNAASDSGRFDNDNYTNVTNPVINMTPTEGNITVYLLRKAASDPDSAYQIVRSVDLPPLLNGASPVPITIQDTGALADGTYTYAVQEIDPAGNLGLISASSAVITIDTDRPVAPSRPVLQPGSDSGVQGDNITNVISPIFAINTAEADPTQVFLKRNGSHVDPSGNPSNPRLGPGAIQDPGPLADATYSYVAYQVDLAGNVGTDSPAQVVRILTVGPAPNQPPTVALLPDDDTGDKGDNRTKVRQPRLYGTAPIPPAEGYILELVQTSPLAGAGVLTTTPDPNTGNYVIQFPNPLPDGDITVIIRVRDVAGNTTSSQPLTLTISNTAPGINPTLGIDPADDTGLIGDNKTSARRPRVVGNTSPGAIVDILDASGIVQATTTALITPSGGRPAGYFSAQLPFELSNGTITLRARARDNVGNVNPNVGTLVMTINTISGDFDGDGKADIGIYRPTDAMWGIAYSASTPGAVFHGWPQHDIPIPADFDGNGRFDVTVFRPETATWFINRGVNLGGFEAQFGWAGHDTPVAADYDGDGKADLAVYRSETAEWFVRGSKTTVPVLAFGWAGHDKPIPADYLGAGRDQIAVWRPETGEWFIRGVNGGPVPIVTLGQMGDIPVPGDYDGIGRIQQAVYRPGTGQFLIYNPDSAQTRIVNVGAANIDVPVPKDYDGDGKMDPAVYRPSTADWLILRSTTNQLFTFSYGWAFNDIALHGPLAYRVAGVNNTSMGVPAGNNGGSFAAQVGAGQYSLPPSSPPAASSLIATAPQTPATARTTSTAPTIIVGATTPGPFQARKAKRQALIAIKQEKAQEIRQAKLARAAARAASRHPLSRLDNALEQVMNERIANKVGYKA